MLQVSVNINRSFVDSISNRLGIGIIANLGKYLGMPVIHGHSNANIYKHILDKVYRRLASWKSQCLFMADQLTLIKSITSTTPIYAMQIMEFPKSICDTINKFNRAFLWRDIKDKKKVY